MGSGYQELKIVSDTLAKTLDGAETYDELRSEVDKVIAQIEFALANKKKRACATRPLYTATRC